MHPSTTPIPSKPADSQEWKELVFHAGAGRAIRIGTSTLTILIVCGLVLTFFSVADFREISYQKREDEIKLRAEKNQQDLAAFSAWLNEKEKDLDRYLLVTGERLDETPSTAPDAAGTAPSYDGIRRNVERLENRIRILSDFQLKDEDYFWNVPSIAPVTFQDDFTLATGPLTNKVVRNGLSGISSFQGPRVHPIGHREEMHYGIDIFCPVGTKVRATANGTVQFVGRFDPNEDNIRFSFGNFIVVRHGDTGIDTTYAHLTDVNVVKGQLVKRADIIGTTGNSGSSTGPHIHYEISRNGTRVNPLNYISDVQLVEAGKKMLYVRNSKKKPGKPAKKVAWK